jgi:hypothetical protein
MMLVQLVTLRIQVQLMPLELLLEMIWQMRLVKLGLLELLSCIKYCLLTMNAIPCLAS